LKQNGQTRVSVEGPLTKAKAKTQAEGTEWLVIQFQPGAFPAALPISALLDGDAVLPLAAGNSFWFHGSIWQLPDYDNVETFVKRLAREEVLLRDPIVNTVLQNQPRDLSARTVRRHFVRATGLTPKAFEQIERAKLATTLLEQGVALLDVAYQAGYADQSHMTRSLKHFIGQTPAHLAQMSTPE
jgi:AraC-like DNA-binding protein